jgi:multiple sugar transport system ATP-binding protein
MLVACANAEIQKLHHRLQMIMIYVTHDQTEAMTMATRLVVMKDGIIQQVGTPKEIYDNPENVFVGAFIGSPAMNLLEGKIVGDEFIINDLSVKIPKAKLE